MGKRDGKIPKWTYLEWMKNMLSSILQEKNSTARCSPLINTIKAPILSSNGFSVNVSGSVIIDSGSYRYVIMDRFIFVIDCKSGIPELQRIVTFHISPSADTERKQLTLLWIFLPIPLLICYSIFVIVALTGGFK